MSKNKGWHDQQRKMQLYADQQSRRACYIARQQTLDKVVIALGEMGLSEDDMRKF